ncbi:hypothetical protein ACN28S_22575 [Cystobacter fuscus]
MPLGRTGLEPADRERARGPALVSRAHEGGVRHRAGEGSTPSHPASRGPGLQLLARREVQAGLWRRTSLAEYQKETPAWELLLDVDELAKKENENWVWHGANCLPAPATRCLVRLSRGGSDAEVVREFDLATRDFVPQGFLVPEAKSEVDWYDENHLLIGTDWGADTLTTSGYPRQVRLWTRGQDLSQAKLLMEADKQDMKIHGYSVFSPEGTKRFVYREKSFFSGNSTRSSRETSHGSRSSPCPRTSRPRHPSTTGCWAARSRTGR